jgi:hypothetical protein
VRQISRRTLDEQKESVADLVVRAASLRRFLG